MDVVVRPDECLVICLQREGNGMRLSLVLYISQVYSLSIVYTAIFIRIVWSCYAEYLFSKSSMISLCFRISQIEALSAAASDLALIG